jgi:hypothetical protein
MKYYDAVTTEYVTVQYSTAQYSTVQYSTAQYSTIQHSTALHSNGAVQCTAHLCVPQVGLFLFSGPRPPIPVSTCTAGRNIGTCVCVSVCVVINGISDCLRLL